jgi:hypothetical protein
VYNLADANTGSHSKAPHTTTQDWPHGSIADPAAAGAQSDNIGKEPFVNTDEASGAGIDRYMKVGTMFGKVLLVKLSESDFICFSEVLSPGAS